ETATRADIADKGVLRPSDALVTEPTLAAKHEMIVGYPTSNKQEAKELAKNVLRGIAADMIVAKGKTVGLPALRAGTKVQILGLGLRFSGPQAPRSYVVPDTTHTFGDGGYTTEFTARMEA